MGVHVTVSTGARSGSAAETETRALPPLHGLHLTRFDARRRQEQDRPRHTRCEGVSPLRARVRDTDGTRQLLPATAGDERVK